MKSASVDTHYWICFVSSTIAIAAIVFVGYLLNFIPNELDTQYIEQTFVLPLSSFVAERSENMQYMVLTVLFPLAFMLSYKFMSRIAKKSSILGVKMPQLLYCIDLPAVLLIAVLTLHKSPYYLGVISKAVPSPFYYLIPVAMLPLFYHGVRRVASRSENKVYRYLLPFASLILCLFSAWLYICNDYFSNGLHLYFHYDAYFYPVYRVFSGQTPMIDFVNLYGNYPYLMMPLIKILGNYLSMYKFSLIIAGLMAVALSCLVYALYKSCRNTVIAFFGSSALLFVAGLYNMLDIGGYFLQYFPHRFLFPALVPIAICLYLRKITPNICTHLAISLLSSLSLIWNLDTGIVVWASCLAMQLYILLWDYELSNKVLYKKAASALLQSLVQVFFAYGVLLAITYMRTGVFLNIKDLLFGQAAFYGSGFFMLRMRLVHPWLLPVSVYGFGLIKSLREIKFLRGDQPNMLSKSVCTKYFTLSVLGMGLFVYFQGRSHDSVLLCTIWPSVFLLTMYANEYYDIISKNIKEMVRNPVKVAVYKLKYISSSLVLVFLSCTLLFVLFIPSNLTFPKEKPSNDVSSPLLRFMPILDDMRYKNETTPDLFMPYASTIYSLWEEPMTQTVQDHVDWFLKSQLDDILNYMSTSDKSIIMSEDSYQRLSDFDPEKFSEIINNNFTLEEERGGFYYLRNHSQ